MDAGDVIPGSCIERKSLQGRWLGGRMICAAMAEREETKHKLPVLESRDG